MLGVGVFLVIVPDASNRVARLVGVGRGADLITYLFEVGVLFVILHYYTKFVELQRSITELVREVTLLRCELNDALQGRDSRSKDVPRSRRS
jgi:small membrane protein